MRTTAQLSFYCRRSKMDRQGQAPIELSIVINGARKFIQFPFKCDPSEFKKKRSQYIRQYVDAQRVNVSRIMAEMAENGIPLTADSLREYIRTGGVKSYTIEDLFTEYYKLLAARVGKTLTKAGYKKYEWVRDLFKQDISFSKEVTAITPAVIQTFYIKLQKRYQDSTSCGMMTKLKTVIKFGMDNGKIKINPFQSTKISKGDKEVTTITRSQLQQIIDHDFTPRVRRVADMFIFAAGSGLSYADCALLTPEDFTENEGQLCIFKNRQKTGVKFYSVLLPWAVEIAKKYNYDFSALQISNQRINSYLKEIQDICGIPLNLHFHLARHFYAMYLLNHKVPITTVSKALGHTNIKTSTRYCRALESTIIKDVSQVF